jgi:tetratricopeptide (TPR) repeat protein
VLRVYTAFLCASAALGQSGRLLPAGADAGYVNSSACPACHRAIAETYARTGMGRSFRAVRSALPEFRGQSFRHAASDQYFVPSVKANRPYLRRFQKAPDGSIINSLEKAVDYVVGSGNHAQTYLHRTPVGNLIELPLTWYSEEGGSWNMSPAYDRPDHSGFSRKITYRCMFCHNAYPEIPPRADEWDGTVFAGVLPEGIDCQRCHGPGRSHIQAVQQARPREQVRASIVNPSRLSRDRQIEVCMQCHLETTSSPLPAARLRDGRGVFSYRPGEPLVDYVLHFDHAPGAGHDDKFEIVSAAYGMRKSNCFQNSGTLTCTTCHDPHQRSGGVEAARRYVRACQSCHQEQIAARVRDRRHPAATECVSCHMQRRRPSDVIHAEMTDHQIRARPLARPLLSPPPVVEENSANTEPYRGEVVLYYPLALPESPENKIDVALAQVADGSNLPEGLARIERSLAQLGPMGRALTFFELGQAWFRAGNALRALTHLEAALQRSPDNWRYLYAAAQASSAAQKSDMALQHLERAREIAPAEAVVLTGLADLHFGRRQFRETISVLQAAIAIDPDMAESHHNLGNALVQTGDMPRAQASFAEAIRLRPEVAAFHMSLASLFARQGDLPQAKYHLESAVRSGVPRDQPNREPEISDRHAILGTLLLRMGDTSAAIREYKAAIAAYPRSATGYLNLGLAFAAARDLLQAEESLATAVALDPMLYEAHLKLGELLVTQGVAQGRTVSAREHLSKAAQSPNAAIRAAAEKLLAAIVPAK